MEALIHPLADVQSAKVHSGTTIWQFVVVLPGAQIGRNCNICSHVFIENDVVVGNDVTIKNSVQLWDGLRLEDGVFIGPGVTFTNDLYPRSKRREYRQMTTIVKAGASLGANSTILCGLEIGRFAMIGAGSLVSKNVGNYELWYGNPARHRGFVTREGAVLDFQLRSKASAERYRFEGDDLVLM